MHVSEVAFKLYAFVYNYSSIKPTWGRSNCSAPKNFTVGQSCWKICQMSSKNTLLTCYTKCIMGYDVSVKLTRKSLKRSKSPT